ncbi:CLUMA_CG005317, isoform A [Clunio marinus]|uniref:CLUMA_CG005317, isoform A n=1 Tax=Clunio marinus TaxID=568069 RepID=A0A1J1HUJ0_9DIPT|nr:CLUMA_CG005317, isoform A [Clunio marinus]
MGSKKKLAQKLERATHANSRRTLAVIRDIKKINKRDKIKGDFATKANIEGKKLSFFAEKIEDKNEALTAEEFEAIINEYFHRFDDELEQIQLKTQINSRRRNQHSSRESIIKITLEKDINNFKAGGMELLDLCDPIQFKALKDWDGNAHNIQHLKMKFISKSYLDQLK